jgi:FKBP-type peptidyl-prolyl cis-trans isomerase FkpA
VIRRLVVTACAVLALGLAACSEAPTGPSSGAPYSQVDLRLGTGADAVSGKNVVVNYTGWLYDPTKTDGKGLQFDTSAGTTPLTFTLGSGQVIQGFDRGVTGMKVGGARATGPRATTRSRRTPRSSSKSSWSQSSNRNRRGGRADGFGAQPPICTRIPTSSERARSSMVTSLSSVASPLTLARSISPKIATRGFTQISAPPPYT